MERKRGKIAALMWVFFVGVVSHNMVLPVMCRSFDGVEDQKNYYSHDPHRGSTHKHTPKGSPKSPSYGAPSPGYGGSGGGSPNSPSYGTPFPGSGGSGGSGGDGGNCETPPQGGGSCSGGSGNCGGGGGGGGGGHSSPYITPPTFEPVTPTTPSAPTVVIPDPNTPPAFPGTCSYWGKHPDLIWGLFGFWGTMSGIFGAACTPAYGQDLSLHQALLNTRNDGIGALYREGAASLLNSMVNQNFPYTAQEVKVHFSAALVSDKAAAAQAQLFQQANEGRLKLKA